MLLLRSFTVAVMMKRAHVENIGVGDEELVSYLVTCIAINVRGCR